jgi:hypothetical protein
MQLYEPSKEAADLYLAFSVVVEELSVGVSVKLLQISNSGMCVKGG